MKNILNILIGILLSVNVFAQTNVSEIKREFEIILQKHFDSLHVKKSDYDKLSPLCLHHLNYCVERDILSHFEDEDTSMYSAKQRFLKFFPNMVDEKYKGGEVMSHSKYGDIKTDKEAAKRIFNCYMNSKAHKKIIDDPKLIYYNFEFYILPNNVVYSIGFLSSVPLK